MVIKSKFTFEPNQIDISNLKSVIARVAGVARAYLFANDKIIDNFKNYNYSFNSYCEAKGIKNLGKNVLIVALYHI